jgi:plastocyanin
VRKALAAAIAGILLVPSALLADDAVPTVPTAPEPPPSTAPAAAPSGDGAAAAAPAPAQAAEMSKPAAPSPRPDPPKPAKRKSVQVRAAASGSVTIKNFAFAPASISVSVGDTVTWINQDSAPHTATGNGGSFNTGTLKKGQSGSHTFTKAGRFAYICAIHPNMRGTVVVAGSTGGGSSQSSGSGSGSGTADDTAAGAQSSAPSGSTLPNTGLELAVVALLGALFTAGGVALRRLADR